jgi:hypothetical protein
MPKAPNKISLNGHTYVRADHQPVRLPHQPVQKAPQETKYQYLISFGPKQYVLFFGGDRRFLGWAYSMAHGLEIPEDAEVAESNYQLALVPGNW